MTDLAELGGHVKAAHARVQQRIGEARAVYTQGAQAEAEVVALERREQVLEETIAVLGSYADASQSQLQAQVEGLVTHGLRLVFDDQDMEFRLVTGTKGKLATTEFIVRSRIGEQVVDTSVLDARGGGVAAVVGFILRVVLLLLRTDADRLLFLDETFAHLSPDYEPKLAEFLRELCDRTGMRILMVTQSNGFDDVADALYRFQLRDGKTVVTREG